MSKMSAARAAWVELLDACSAAAQFEKLPRGFITMPTDHRRTREGGNFHCVAGVVRQGCVSMLRAAGFGQAKYRNLSMGIAALHSGWKL